MASFADIWSGLQQAGKPLPYMLVDCAGIEGGQSRIPADIFSELECLFTGDLAVELADVGPYLGRINSFHASVAATVEELLTRQVGMLVVLQDVPADMGEPTFSQVHRHFRKLNVVYGPDGNPLFFRYYDPRVVVDVLQVMDAQQLQAFFGPVDKVVLVDQAGRAVQCQCAHSTNFRSRTPIPELIADSVPSDRGHPGRGA
jgi:hypothetical protein